MAASDLLFSQTANASGGPVEIVFGDEGAAPPAPPPSPPVKGELLFSDPANPTNGPVEIVFGDDEPTPPSTAVDLLASGTITGLHGSIIARAVASVGAAGAVTGLHGSITTRIGARLQAIGTITGLHGSIPVAKVPELWAAGTITGLRGRVAATYDVNVDRSVAADTRTGWQPTRRLRASQQQRFEQALRTVTPLQNAWQNADHLGAVLQTQWQQAQPIAAIVHQALQQARPVGNAPTAQQFEQAARLRAHTVQRLQQAQPFGAAPTAQRFEDATRLRALVRNSFDEARHAQATAGDSFGRGMPLSRVIVGVYQPARKPPPGVGDWRPKPPPPEPCYRPDLPAHLVFDAPWSSDAGLVFVCNRHVPPGPGPEPEPGQTVVVPIRSTYIVINNITLHRVDTGAELHAHSFSMSLDHQSWTWTWNASLHNDAAAHLGRDSAGDPAELAVLVNGIEFRLRLEAKSRDRRFSPTRWSVSGRGKNAVLGSADAPKQSFRNTADRTAQQLMADVLTVNGVPMGWTVDWSLQDWLVPAGAWAIQGNYIDAINDIAGAVGGYVQPHATAATLRVLPRYPLAPWHWGSVRPDFEIPADAAEVEGTQFIDKPAYNRVYVGGIGAGVFGPFDRAGTAGNVIAPQVNHALITHPDAHRQRGIAELSDTGRQERITLNMQVLPETGVIVPGQFVRYLGDAPVMGIVRSTSIDWSRPRLRQTLEIEVHA